MASGYPGSDKYTFYFAGVVTFGRCAVLMFAGRKKTRAAKEVPAWKLQLEAAEAAPPPAHSSVHYATASSSDGGCPDGSSGGGKCPRYEDDNEAESGRSQDEFPLRDGGCTDDLKDSDLHDRSSLSRSSQVVLPVTTGASASGS